MAKLRGLAALRQAGGFRGVEPRKEEITWKNDEGEEFTFDIWVKPMAFGAALDIEASNDPNRMASTLCNLVLLEDEAGKRVPLDMETARSLNPRLGFEIIKAVNKANAAPKNSQPPTSSSANSSSTESAAEPSQKPATD